MKFTTVCCLIFFAVLHVRASGRRSQDEGEHLPDGLLGFSLELLLNKLDAMEQKLQKMENEILENRSKQGKSQKEMLIVLKKFEHQIAHNFSELQQRIEKKIPSPSSCKTVSTNVSGAYMIELKNVGVTVPFRVSCEQQAFGGGWIVIHYRYDGSLNFYRGWNEFRDGFGNLDKEFWLGLEKVHQITKDRKHELMIELKYFDGTYKYAHYHGFEIGSESEEYVLKGLGSYNGSAGNKMAMNGGMKFTTKDRDNDVYGENCAQIYQGAWWYRQCTAVNLNGQYINTNNKTSMHWADSKGDRHGLSYSRMMIRELV